VSVKVVLEFQTAPDQVDAVKKMFWEVLPDTRAYEGFEGLTMHQDQDDPTKFLLFEQWETRPHYEAYLAWRTDTGFVAQLMPMLAGAPSIRFFNHVGA
jgi:quinol monooxygenase YgiN